MQVLWKGRQYFPHCLPCEQPDADLITRRRLRNQGLAETAKTIITEYELQNFTKIYPRLYQVSKVSQARLRAWAAHNEDVIKRWDVGDFFKSPAADMLDGTKPRKPGCPLEVMELWKNQINSKKNKSIPDGNGNPETSTSSTGNPSLTNTQMMEDNLPTTELPPIVHIQHSYPNYKVNIQELDVSLGTIQAVAFRLEWLSGRLKSDDLIKNEMLVLAQTLKTNVNWTGQVSNAILQDLNKTAISNSHGEKRGNDLMIEGTGRNEDKHQRHVRAKHAHDLASLEDECDTIREDGTLISNLNDGAITKECQANHQGDSPEHPFLGPYGGPIETFDSQLDIELLNPDELCYWESSSRYSDEPFNNFTQESHRLEQSVWPIAAEEKQVEAANSQVLGNKGEFKIHGSVEECVGV